MALFSPAFLSLRRDPRLLKLPPYLSALCIITGVLWLLLLPLNRYSRQTYISENALLPGQVHTYFGGSEQNVFRAYRTEVEDLATQSNDEIVTKVAEIFLSSGLKVARQRYEYTSSAETYSGENIYAILHAPRGDATEAIVLVAGWLNVDGELNQSGVAIILTLARYFKRWSLWSKDIIFLVAADSRAGPQAWVDAYHDTQSSDTVAPLPLKSGALQGAVVVDYPFSHRFDSIHVIYDGINGQLPNLDLFNTAVSIASGQMSIATSLQKMWMHDDSYEHRLNTMLRGMLKQGFGHASGPHSSFIPYHIDAITLQAVGEGWHDEMAMGRTVESIFRSLNNLLEHFHQSFFFYLLMQANRFVSIGTYLPSAMLIAINFTIMAIALWVQSGRPPISNIASTDSGKRDAPEEVELIKRGGMVAIAPTGSSLVVERKLFLPLIFVVGIHLCGFIPLYVFNHSSKETITTTFIVFSVLSFFSPYLLSLALTRFSTPTSTQVVLIRAFSLLLLGMFLSALATLNFSLSFLIGLLCCPFTFIRPAPGQVLLAAAACIVLCLLGPSAILLESSMYWNMSMGEILIEGAFAWNICGLRTQVVVWCVWWPAWQITLALAALPLQEHLKGKG